MKRITLLFCLLSLTFLFQACDEEISINGDWKLIKVETPQEVLIPKVDYLVNVQEKKINFNLDVNSCFADIEIKNDSIKYSIAACTKMCCDGNIDPISGFLNYSGAYTFQNDTLIITNDNKYFLMKITKD